ncbi:MAG: type II toxin-antitoxin system HicA family toxin [Methanosarcina sp.]|jgi:predicted RNA binding protein YcfA (HicA-like mRNA interferase family)|uniref:type II toxin-antitoxin system HicA family toxin n=1 Tax=Methanosarcina sp. TaxID=2213 RepID=UPI003BB545F1
MSKILPLPAKKVVKALENIGFKQLRQKGSHLFLQHPDGRTTIVPMHPTEKIGRGMINKITKDAKITRDEWIELINSLILF